MGKSTFRKLSFGSVLAVIFPLSGLALYAHTLRSGFQFDDLYIVLENFKLRDLSNLSYFLSRADERFLTTLTFALNYKLHQADVFGYHLVNLAIHVLASILVACLTRRVFQTPVLEGKLKDPEQKTLAVLSGLLFLVHPVQTQAVTYIVQRSACLAALIYAATLLLYVHARLTGSRGAYAAAVFLAAAAMFTKQTAFTLPLAVLMAEVFFFLPVRNPKQALKTTAPFLATLLIVPGIRIIRAVFVIQDSSMVLRQTASIGQPEYLFTQFNVLVTYLRLLVFPVGQNLDYDFPVSHSLFEHGAWASLLLLTIIFLAGCKLYKDHRLPAFAIMMFFLTLSVESSLIPIRDVIFEHRLYLPMVGISMAVPFGLYLLIRNIRKTAVLMFIVLLVFSGATWRRNTIWADGITLWQDVVQKSPNKARPYRNLAFHFNEAGNYQSAITACEKAIELEPQHSGCFLTLGIAYGRMGQVESEIKYYKAALQRNPQNEAKLFNNLGSAYGKQGNLQAAVAIFRKGLEKYPSYPPLHNNLGFAYDAMGAQDKALASYKRAIGLNPDFAEAFNNMGIAFAKLGRLEEAVSAGRRAIALSPDYADAYNNLGVIFGMLGREADKVAAFESAIKADPSYERAYINLIKHFREKGDSAQEKAVISRLQARKSAVSGVKKLS